MATRAAAARLAMLVGEPLGQRVGYAMRGERSGGKGLRVEVVTTGLLVRRLQQNPELPGVAAIVIDECHERHLDADLLLAFCVDIRANLREDLAIVATSATADTVRLSRALGAEVVTASAALFDVAIEWAPPPVPVPLLRVGGSIRGCSITLRTSYGGLRLRTKATYSCSCRGRARSTGWLGGWVT